VLRGLGGGGGGGDVDEPAPSRRAAPSPASVPATQPPRRAERAPSDTPASDWRAVVRDADRAPARASATAPASARPIASGTPQAPEAPSKASRPGRPTTASDGVATSSAPHAALPDLHLVTERWDDLVARVRAAGKSVAATALEHATPTAVNAKGDVTIALDEANPIYERALESTKGDVAAVLGEWFPAVQRVVVRAAEGGGPPPARLTDEMVRSERLTSLRRKDPVLDAAIEALDLDLAD
jgi:hypothetical protein